MPLFKNPILDEFGPFDAFRNRLPTIQKWNPAYIDEMPYMKANNINAQQTYNAMFGDKALDCNNKSKIVNKIVEVSS